MKKWWIDNKVGDWLGAAATTISLLTCVYFIFWVIHETVAVVVTFVGIAWAFKIIIGASLGYTAVAMYQEFTTYQKDPRAWMADEENDDVDNVL